MPHLSPLRWLIIIVIITLTITILNSISWWKPQIKFITINKNIQSFSNYWKW